ncbi:ABC transporter ATP-binding protein [Candidatus Omnitrophota bacterium]
MLEIKNLSKDFYPLLSFTDIARLRLKRPKVRALNDVSLTLKQGDTLAVLGPNGAGKTTLLKIISTLILPDKGKVKVNGLTVGIDDHNIKASIGLVSSEERSFYWRLTGRQNLEFFAAFYGLNKQKTNAKIDQLLRVFKIDYENKRFDSYSTGMKRKLALARALLHDPKLILFDEPTKSLDYNSSEDLRNVIKKLTEQGKTILFTTHNIEESQKICNLFMFLHKGKIAGLGTKEELTRNKNALAVSLTEIYQRLTKDD